MRVIRARPESLSESVDTVANDIPFMQRYASWGAEAIQKGKTYIETG